MTEEKEDKYNATRDFYTTTSSQVWRRLWNDIEMYDGCGLCMPGHGCNRRNKPLRWHHKSWKKFREHQWK